MGLDISGATTPRLGCFIQTLTYTGNGTTSQKIDTTIHPLYARIWNRETSDNQPIYIYEATDTVIDDHANGMCILISTEARSRTNRIISFAADGFTVDDSGTDSHPNKNGQVYNVLVLGY